MLINEQQQFQEEDQNDVMALTQVDCKIRKDYKKRRFQKINQFELMDAVKLNLITSGDARKLIKDPNQYTIFQERINAESPATKKALSIQQVLEEDLQMAPYSAFMVQTQKNKKEGEEEEGDFTAKLTQRVNYLQHCTQRYEVLKQVLQQRNRIKQIEREIQKNIKNNKLQFYMANGKQNMLQTLGEHTLYQNKEMGATQMNERDEEEEEREINEGFRSSSVLKVGRGEAEKVRQMDYNRHASSVSYLQRHQEIVVKQKAKNEHLVNSIKANTAKCITNKEKLMTKRQVLLKHMLGKVDDAKSRVERIKDDRQEKMEKYYEKQKETNQKQLVILEEKQKAEALVIDQRESNRLAGIQTYQSNKFKKQQSEIEDSLQQLHRLGEDGLQKQFSKQLGNYQIVQKLKTHSQHVEQNYQKAEEMIKSKKTKKEKEIWEGLKSQQQYNLNEQKKAEKEAEEVKARRDYISERNTDNHKDGNCRYKDKMERAEEKLKDRLNEKEDKHSKVLQNRKTRLQQEEEKRQSWLINNTQVLNMKREDHVSRLDNKFMDIEDGRLQGQEDTNDVILNRFSLRNDIIQRKVDQNSFLEKVNRSPTKYH